MRCISEWFDRHPKVRIALQLLLDAAPFALLLGFGGCAFNLFSYPLELEWLIHVGILGFFILTVPLFILGIWLRGRAEGDFACYPWCERVSRLLRILGALAVSFCVILGVFFILAYVPA